MDRMKALWLCNSGVGKSETFLMESINLLSSAFDLTVVCGSPPSGVAQKGIHYGRFGSVPLKLWHTLIKKFLGINHHLGLQRKQCDEDVKKVLAGTQPSFVWLEFGTTAWVAEDVLERLDVPFFIHVHGYDITKAFSSEAYRCGFVKLANKAAAVICASHHTKMLCQVAGVEVHRLSVIRYAIDQTRFPATETKTSHPSFIHFGRLTDKKGPLITLEAFALVAARHPQARLTFVGDGPQRSMLEERVQLRGLEESVQILPGMDWNEGMSLVSQHWVYCQHSITALDGDQEGFALSPAEAAILGLPVVSTWHNGIPEHVVHRETGLLSREHDFETMAQHMMELIEDEPLRHEMGRKGRENILRMCDPTVRRERLLDLIQSSL